MKITDIQLQKNKKYYNIFVDGEFRFSMDSDLILSLGITKGKEVSEDYIKSLYIESILRKAFQQSLTYLSYKMRTKEEVKKYLEDKEYSLEVIEDTIKNLTDYKYIDDDNYVQMYIKSRISSGFTINKIRYKLIEKGIDENTINKNLEDLYPNSIEIDLLIKEISKLNSKYSNLPYRDKATKITQSCIRKGFKMEDIKKYISEIVQEEETEEFILKFNKEVKKYISKYKNKGLEEREIRQKTMEALYRKGYDMDIIKKYFKDNNTN